MWWLKLRHPVTGQVIRHSLETADSARAELLRKRIEAELALLHPCIQSVEMATRLRTALGLNVDPAPAPMASALALPSPQVIVSTLPVFPTSRRTAVGDAVSACLRFIATENAALHAANKVSMLRRFLGAERVEKLGGPVKTKRRRTEDGKHAA